MRKIIEKRRYAKWKAADILKALKEGRVPQRGAANEVCTINYII